MNLSIDQQIQTSKPKTTISWWNIIGKIFVFVILTIFAFQLFTAAHPWIFLDSINLLIHEAGHLIFSFFGKFIYFLAGSLFQCLIPISFLIYFFRTKQYFATGFSLFWLGDNLISVATYMKDARTLTLPLLGGETHDWNWLFSHMGLLKYDQLIGTVIFLLGTICVICALALSLIIIHHEIRLKLTNI